MKHVVQLQQMQRNNLMKPLIPWRFNKCHSWIEEKVEHLFHKLNEDSNIDEIAMLEEEEEDEDDDDDEDNEDDRCKLHKHRRNIRKRQLMELNFVKMHYGYPALSKKYSLEAKKQKMLYQETLNRYHLQLWLKYTRFSGKGEGIIRS
jgi:hypothetical protein